MKSEFKYPEWQEPLFQAVLDCRRLPAMETDIRERLLDLIDTESLEEEQALMDALSTIRVLKHGA
jgi:hypothetical protein